MMVRKEFNKLMNKLAEYIAAKGRLPLETPENFNSCSVHIEYINNHYNFTFPLDDGTRTVIPSWSPLKHITEHDINNLITVLEEAGVTPRLLRGNTERYYNGITDDFKKAIREAKKINIVGFNDFEKILILELRYDEDTDKDAIWEEWIMYV